MPDREIIKIPANRTLADLRRKNESFRLPPTAGSAQRKKNSKAASKSRWPIIQI